MNRRIICAVGAAISVVIASLAFAGAALAAPSTPKLAPLPLYVSVDQQLNWTASVLDSSAQPAFSAYEFRLFDMTKAVAKLAIDPAGYNPDNYTSHAYSAYTQSTTAKLNVLFPNVVEGDEYHMCVRMDEVTSNYDVTFSPWSCVPAFIVAHQYKVPKLILDKYIQVNPDPGCPQCGLAKFVSDDPIVYRAISSAVVRDPTPITGLRVDARGNVAVVYG